jgi:hypothetical protein
LAEKEIDYAYHEADLEWEARHDEEIEQCLAEQARRVEAFVIRDDEDLGALKSASSSGRILRRGSPKRSRPKLFDC